MKYRQAGMNALWLARYSVVLGPYSLDRYGNYKLLQNKTIDRRVGLL